MRVISGHLTYLGFLIVVGIVSTLYASLAGQLVVLAAVWPISIFAKNFAPTVIFSLAHGAVYMAPVTLVVLPIAGWFLKSRRLRALIILPLIGTVSGIAAMWCWMNFSVLPYGGIGGAYLLAAGLFGGLVAGAFFGHSVYRVAR